MIVYTVESLISNLNQFYDNDVTFLIGAGCSISSGCMAAHKLTLEFKKRLYCARHNISFNDRTFINDLNFEHILNSEFPSNMSNPYSYYFSLCFKTASDRNKFIKDTFHYQNPSSGYLCFASYIINHNIQNIITTNFDKLIEKSIRKLDINRNIVLFSENLKPKESGDLNIFNLHGDYNYDFLKNTSDELKTVEASLEDTVESLGLKTIIVMGYSGQDESVMNLLSKLSHNNVRIIWCDLRNPVKDNSKISDLLNINSDSGYCIIYGFDEFFYSVYKVLELRNDIVDKEVSSQENIYFDLDKITQYESLITNVHDIVKYPYIYKIEKNKDINKITEFNLSNKKCYILQFCSYLYVVGKLEPAVNFLNEERPAFIRVFLGKESLPKRLLCKILKEFITICCQNNGISVFKDNLYVDSPSPIKEGLKINVDIFNNEICLKIAVNYFVIENKTDNLKFEINKLKSSLFANKNYEKLINLQKTILNNSLRFSLSDNVLQFNNEAVLIKNGSSNIYSCVAEPKMSVDRCTSENQIKLINSYGPIEVKYSYDKIKVGIFCPDEYMNILRNYLEYVVSGTKSYAKFGDVVPEFVGFKSIFKKDIQFIINDILSFTCSNTIFGRGYSFEDFKGLCLAGIKRLSDSNKCDIVLIFIPSKLSAYRNNGYKDLHDQIKLICANKYKTQFLEEETINSKDSLNKRIFNLATGLYTKTIGIPWYPETYDKDTIYVGMGFAMNSTSGITVGCSQLFDGAGRGLQLIVTPISDKKKKNQYLTRDEAVDLGSKILATYYTSSKAEPLKRIVIHRNSPFRKEEIEGFKLAFSGILEFDLIQISFDSTFNCYVQKGMSVDGFPVRRGTIIKFDYNSAYLWLDGSVRCFDILNGYVYRNSKRGMGYPLVIRKFYGKSSINKIASELMVLSKMDFNSSDVIYSKLPVTIKYAEKVCQILKQGNFEDELISFQYIM